jgi:hypothetical protein
MVRPCQFAGGGKDHFEYPPGARNVEHIPHYQPKTTVFTLKKSGKHFSIAVEDKQIPYLKQFL